MHNDTFTTNCLRHRIFFFIINGNRAIQNAYDSKDGGKDQTFGVETKPGEIQSYNMKNNYIMWALTVRSRLYYLKMSR